MKIVFVASEVTPIVKVGGLADVVGALPGVLHDLGHTVEILMPGYSHLQLSEWKSDQTLEVPWQGKRVSVTLRTKEFTRPGLQIVAVDAPEVMQALSGVYAESNQPSMQQKEIERFVFFSRAAAAVLVRQPPDIVHCHDWHAALIPLMARVDHRLTLSTLLTIHNLNIQGKWNAEAVFGWLGWQGNEHSSLQARDRDGDFNAFQQGILNAGAVNTVSPTYAKEILSPEHGEGLDQALRERRNGVHGIVNGIDVVRFDPAKDSDLVAPYNQGTVQNVKPENKRALQKELGLPEDPKMFLLGSVGRLNNQKGYQLLPTIVEKMLVQKTQLVILGSGMEELERALAGLAQQFPQQMKLIVKFDAHLAQRIYAAADAFLMPSLFEPCGLGQMIAMRYGTLPIVRDTGGLHDTVQDVHQAPDRGTGFVFESFTPDELLHAVERARQLYHDSAAWQAAQQRAMAQDFSWERSAQAYLDLYAKINK